MQNFPIILPNYPDKVFNEMIFVEGGSFMFGDGSHNNNPPTSVKVSDFYISKYLVTQDLYEAVMGENLSYFKGAHRPVDQASWLHATQFCNELSKKMGKEQVYDIQDVKNGIVIPDLSKNGFSLPSEAVWEYTARGGKFNDPYKFSGSDYLKEVGWYGENSHQETKPVGLKLPNALGLYDMSGNVWEWCEDDIGGSYTIFENNTNNPINNKYRRSEYKRRIIRGGSWSLVAVSNGLVSFRNFQDFDIQEIKFGFRLFFCNLTC
jgi:formylglycine-generating enzyme required for sulfatase activity